MSEPTIEELRERIAKACEAAEARGIQIVSEEWGLHYGDDNLPSARHCCCPLGAVAVCEALPDVEDEHAIDVGGIPYYLGRNQDFEGLFARHLGVPRKWVDSFVEGVDSVGTSDGADVSDAWQLGREFRARYVKP